MLSFTWVSAAAFACSSFIFALAFNIRRSRRFLGSVMASSSLRRSYACMAVFRALARSTGSLKAWERGLSFSSVLRTLMIYAERESSSSKTSIADPGQKSSRKGSLFSAVPLEIMITASEQTRYISWTNALRSSFDSGPHYAMNSLCLPQVHHRYPCPSKCQKSYP